MQFVATSARTHYFQPAIGEIRDGVCVCVLALLQLYKQKSQIYAEVSLLEWINVSLLPLVAVRHGESCTQTLGL